VFEAVQDGLIREINWPFPYEMRHSRRIQGRSARGWTLLHESGTYLKFTGGRGPVRMNLAGVIVFWQWGRTIH
jgi:hypothetical protein